VDDIFGELNEEAFENSTLFSLLQRHRPHIVIDCINTATAIAYQSLFQSAQRLREAASEKRVYSAEVEAHLTMLYLPQLIRHVQLLLEGTRRAKTRVYLKIGTSGTGGMGLNVPFTHSEERPSRSLLAKASVAGAHSLLLFLMARTPDSPVVKEVKPTAAIAWQSIAFGPVLRGRRPIPRYDAVAPVVLEEALDPPTDEVCERLEDAIESVWLDAGENGLFSLAEFEAISELRMMEIITPEEIAETTIDEIIGRATGRDIIAALDASSSGPTYRGGMMREAALRRMEELEEEHGVRSIAFEMLGPPRLSKLLFEVAILRELFDDGRAVAQLDEKERAERAAQLIEAKADASGPGNQGQTAARRAATRLALREPGLGGSSRGVLGEMAGALRRVRVRSGRWRGCRAGVRSRFGSARSDGGDSAGSAGGLRVPRRGQGRSRDTVS
jgi:hypothetical protein